MPVAHSGVVWRRIFVVLLLIAGGAYWWYGRGFQHGGTRIGLVYGTIGFVLCYLLAYFGIRKRAYRSRFGTLEQWLQSHIYLGVLVLLILFFHTGGRFNDKIAVATFVLAAIVIVSGIFGAIIYVAVPRLLTEVESNLTPEEISDQLNQLAKQMTRMASGRSAPFQRIYTELIRESTPGWLAGWRLLLTRHRHKKLQAASDWTTLLGIVPKDEQDALRQMLVVSRQHKELLLRLVFYQRYKNFLESWLYVHVPFTIALLVFAVVHIAAVFYYGRVTW